MKKRNIWFLTDVHDRLIIAGAKMQVENKMHWRYVYGGIYTDNLYRTHIELTDDNLREFICNYKP